MVDSQFSSPPVVSSPVVSPTPTVDLPSAEATPPAAPTKPLNYLSASPSPRRTGPALSPVEMEEARWAATFSLGTFRLVLMPLLVLIFILWMVICVLFIN